MSVTTPDPDKSHPLFASALRRPLAERSRLPNFDGSKPEDRHRWVKLNELRASRGYQFDAMVVVLGPVASDLAVHRLSDVKGLRLGVEEGTLADAILMAYDGGALIPSLTHISRGGDLFESMERGEFAVTLVELHRFDAYVLRYPGTKLLSSGHYHSIGFNVGMVGLASEASLLHQVDDATGAMLDSDELPVLARAARVTYLPAREPNVRATISSAELRSD
jgi:hypothetical protein